MTQRFKHLWLAVSGIVLMSWLSICAQAADNFLDPDQAFKLNADLADTKTVTLNWIIAPGYKLYRGRLHVGTESKETRLGAPVLPDGISTFDENLGEQVEIYHDQLAVAVPIAMAKAPFILKVTYQGCAEAGLCYPPTVREFSVDPAHPGPLQIAATAIASPVAATATAPATASAVPEDDSSLAKRTLHSGSLWQIGLAFGLFGLLLAFTPCVLPMVPILSSIIVGESVTGRRHGFLLALAYSLGMALVYTSVGIAAGLVGEGMAGALQKPWVLVTFALLLVALALSMFDVYQLQMPAALQTRLTETSSRLKGGRFIGVFVMGALSALIVGPCVAGPLAGALVYISQTRDVVIGGWALFTMAMGMSVPLLLTGLSAGSLLPRAGAWMDEVKSVFGLMLIAVAIWMVTPILPEWALPLAWGIFALVCAVFLRVLEPLPARAGIGARFGKATGLAFLILGVLELVGAASGGRDVMQPLAHIQATGSSTVPASPEARFTRVRSVAELEQSLQAAKTPVLLDFYADWCVACKEMERFTFSDPGVAGLLGKMTLLQVDVTANNADDRALMKKFNLFGPPGIILFNPVGKEIENSRVIGYKAAADFISHMRRHLAGSIN